MKVYAGKVSARTKRYVLLNSVGKFVCLEYRWPWWAERERHDKVTECLFLWVCETEVEKELCALAVRL